MGYWATVAARAFKESIAFVGWPSVTRLAQALFIGGVVAALTWLLTGDLATSLRTYLTVGVTLTMALGVFLFKLLAVPKAMAKEQAEEIARLNAKWMTEQAADLHARRTAYVQKVIAKLRFGKDAVSEDDRFELTPLDGDAINAELAERGQPYRVGTNGTDFWILPD